VKECGCRARETTLGQVLSSLCSCEYLVHLEYSAHAMVSHNIVLLPERLESSMAPYTGRESYPLTDPSTRRCLHWRLCLVGEGERASSHRHAYRSIRGRVSEGPHRMFAGAMDRLIYSQTM
jgi:hypothetical protein